MIQLVSTEDVEKLMGMIGMESEPYQVEITKGVIWRLAEAMGDTNPLWRNEDEAKKSKYGGIIGPPAVYTCNLMNPFRQGGISLPVKGRHLDAWHEWEFYALIRPGDVITVTGKIVDVYERRGKKSGRMVFCVLETTLTNQRGEIVCVGQGSGATY